MKIKTINNLARRRPNCCIQLYLGPWVNEWMNIVKQVKKKWWSFGVCIHIHTFHFMLKKNTTRCPVNILSIKYYLWNIIPDGRYSWEEAAGSSSEPHHTLFQLTWLRLLLHFTCTTRRNKRISLLLQSHNWLLERQVFSIWCLKKGQYSEQQH